jgi:hypothetical protein
MKWHAKAPDGHMDEKEAKRAVKQYLRDKKINIRIKIDQILKMLVKMGFAFR